MNPKININADNRAAKSVRQRRWKRIVAILAMIVLVSTVSALVLPAITVEKKPICGLEEHVHGPECYREERVLICGYPDPAEPESSEPAPSAPEETLPPEETVKPDETTAEPAAPNPAPAEPIPEETEAVTEPETVPETTAEETVSETTAETVPETTGETVPEATGETVPEATGETVPETTAETIPEETVPETTAPDEPLPEPSEEPHVHTDACYEIRKVLICTKQEHTHTEQCYEQPDPYADRETPADWEATLSQTPLTGSWAEDTLALAGTQLGYQESTRNFTWSEAGYKMGYSRYGDWYGDEYGDWCAMFISFCLHYAQVPAEAIPPQSNCPMWMEQLKDSLVSEGQPGRGDILFIDNNQDGNSDHVALVDRVEDGIIHTIEGNAADAVQQVQYLADSPVLMSHCSVSELQRKLTVQPEFYTLTFEDDKMTVTVTIRGMEIPAGAVLQVQELTPDNAPEAYGAAMEQGEALLKEDHHVSGFNLFDLAVFDGETKLTVPETAQVTVQVRFREPLFTPEQLAESADLQTLVLDDLAQPAVPQTTEAAAPEQTEPVSPAARSMPSPAPMMEAPPAEEPRMENEGADITYQANGLSPFAVMLTNHTQQGKFWKVVRDTGPDSLQDGASYLIVSVEGGYALTNNLNGGSNYTKVELQPVKGNPDYYTVDSIPEKAIWKYKYSFLAGGTRNFEQLIKPGWRPVKNYLNPATQMLFQTGEINLGFAKSNCPACFNLSGGQYYLNFNGDTGTFLGSTSQKLFAKQPNFTYARTSDILILKQVDATLTIPDDAVAQDGGSGQMGTGKKPAYPGYIAPTGEKTGSYEDPSGKVDYYSDPATTQLEQYFGQKGNRQDFQAKKDDNGKVLMDKSVIYGQNDYYQFPQYEDGTFSVTLSALGQSFLTSTSTTKVPLDVLLILDMSNSMNETDAGQSVSRAQVLVDSVNKTMNNIMKAHPENRVCAVGYNSGAYDLLNLGHHWKGEGGQYFKYKPTGQNQWGQPSGEISATGLSGAFGTPVPCENGTYTQLGIAQGYDLLMRQTPNPEDTTYTVTVNGQTVTRPRKPVIILVSDGEPTHCTPHYMDVMRNPYYGDGLAPITNGKGAQGYYTILSANYYKRMVGIHYNNPATMYTVAFAMKEGSTDVEEGSVATSHYRATVMNPTNDNIETLNTIKAPQPELVEKALYKMLRGTYSGEPQKLGGVFNFAKLNNRLGDPHSYIPIMQENPYRDNYAYADKAYLNNSGNGGLDAAFRDIIQLNTVYDFTYETQADVPLILSDPIGDGMEVKGDPILRINGQNYAHTGKQNQGNAVIYTYSGVVPMDPHTGRTVDLATIRVRVETAGGRQKVIMEIPPHSLPTYTADPTLSFFHEALPVRLIYQVGLSSAGQAEIDALQPGQVKTFYTNQYVSDHASGSLDPSGKNHYYQGTGWELNNSKTHNTTGTDGYSLVMNGNTQKVNYQLGNNGKLVITKKAPPAPPVEPVSVQKFWEGYNGDPMTENLPQEIHLKLYRTYVDDTGTTIREDVVEDFVLNAANGWKRTFTPEELKAVPGREYRYYVEELTKLPDFLVSYEADGILSNTPETPIEIHNRYRYSDVVLPATGGPGTALFTGMGLMLMVAAILLYRTAMRPKHAEGRKHDAS